MPGSVQSHDTKVLPSNEDIFYTALHLKLTLFYLNIGLWKRYEDSKDVTAGTVG